MTFTVNPLSKLKYEKDAPQASWILVRRHSSHELFVFQGLLLWTDLNGLCNEWQQGNDPGPLDCPRELSLMVGTGS